MKVADLKKGMMLKIADPKKRGWMTLHNPMPNGEPEIRFVDYFMTDLLPGKTLPEDALIVYLGHDKEYVSLGNAFYKTLVRRIMVNGVTAVIQVMNFKHLVPHPDFT